MQVNDTKSDTLRIVEIPIHLSQEELERFRYADDFPPVKEEPVPPLRFGVRVLGLEHGDYTYAYKAKAGNTLIMEGKGLVPQRLDPMTSEGFEHIIRHHCRLLKERRLHDKPKPEYRLKMFLFKYGGMIDYRLNNGILATATSQPLAAEPEALPSAA